MRVKLVFRLALYGNLFLSAYILLAKECLPTLRENLLALPDPPPTIKQIPRSSLNVAVLRDLRTQLAEGKRPPRETLLNALAYTEASIQGAHTAGMREMRDLVINALVRDGYFKSLSETDLIQLADAPQADLPAKANSPKSDLAIHALMELVDRRYSVETRRLIRKLDELGPGQFPYHDALNEIKITYAGADPAKNAPAYQGLPALSLPRANRDVNNRLENPTTNSIEFDTGANKLRLCPNCPLVEDISKVPEGSLDLFSAQNVPWDRPTNKPEELRDWLNEIKSKLKPGGAAVFTVPLPMMYLNKGDAFKGPATLARKLGFRVRRYEGTGDYGMILDVPPRYPGSTPQ